MKKHPVYFCHWIYICDQHYNCSTNTFLMISQLQSMCIFVVNIWPLTHQIFFQNFYESITTCRGPQACQPFADGIWSAPPRSSAFNIVRRQQISHCHIMTTSVEVNVLQNQYMYNKYQVKYQRAPPSIVEVNVFKKKEEYQHMYNITTHLIRKETWHP